MRASDSNQDMNSGFEQTSDSTFHNPSTSMTGNQGASNTAQNQQQIVKPEPFDDFVKRFPVTLFYFSQNPKTAPLVEESDTSTIVGAMRNLQRNQFITYFSTISFNIIAMNVINRNNKIFGLTRRVSIWGILLKYMALPNVITDIVSRLVLLPGYYRVAEPVKNKYSFQDPIFRTEYESDPEPEIMIRSFYKTHLGARD